MKITDARLKQIIMEELKEGPVADAIGKQMDIDKKTKVPQVEALIANILKTVGPAIMKAANGDKGQALQIKEYLKIALDEWSP